MGYGAGMKSRTDRRLALDPMNVDLGDPDQLAAFVARYGLAPARRAYQLPDPRPDEGDDLLFEREEELPSGGRIRHLRAMHFEHPAAHFDEILRGLLLFAHLRSTAKPSQSSACASSFFVSRPSLLPLRPAARQKTCVRWRGTLAVMRGERHPDLGAFAAGRDQRQLYARDTRLSGDAPLRFIREGEAERLRAECRAGDLICPVPGCADPRYTTAGGTKRDHFRHRSLAGGVHAPIAARPLPLTVAMDA